MEDDVRHPQGTSILSMSKQPWFSLANVFRISLVALVVNVGLMHRLAEQQGRKQQLVVDEASIPPIEQDEVASKRKEKATAHASGTRKAIDVSTMNSPAEGSIPPSENVPPSSRVAACLLLKDDNDILPEWLAYHMHTLNMRDLIVAVDPTSATRPDDLLARWSAATQLRTTIWSDPDFMPQDFLETGYHTSPDDISGNATASKWHEGHEDPATVVADTLQILNHRFRQVTFLKKCLREFRDRGNRWVMHIDTDEFVVVNPLLRNTTQKNVAQIQVPESLERPGAVMSLLGQFLTQEDDLQRKVNYPCVSMPRLLFGSLEDNASNDDSTPISKRFETLRWKYHTTYDDTDRNAQPKVLIDVSAVPPDESMFTNPFSIHRPSMRLCRRLKQLNFTQLQRFPISVNHYVGSWERYDAKNDTRRSRRAYDHKAVLPTVLKDSDGWIDSWLSGFLALQPQAKPLLEEHYGSFE